MPSTPLHDPLAAPLPGATTRNAEHDLLHVRVPLRHSRARAQRRGPLHRRQSGSPDQQGRDLRQGQLGDHEAVLAGAAHEAAAAQARRRARRGRVRRGELGRGLSDAGGAARAHPRHRPQAVRDVHRPRPDAGADRTLRAAVRHAQLRGARRLLLGQHGRRDDLHDRRLVLGVRRPRPRPREALRDDRHRRGPSFQSAEDRDLEVQARRRALHLDQSDPHRLFGDRRRVGADSSRHRRRAAARAHPRDHGARALRPRVPRALHQRRAARQRRRPTPTTPACWCAATNCRPIPIAHPSTIAIRCGGTASRIAPCLRTPKAPIRLSTASSRCPTGAASSRCISCSSSASPSTRPSGRPRSPAYPRRRSIGSRRSWASPRATRRSSCRSRGPTRGDASTTP